MKKILILMVMCTTLLLSGCEMNLSNFDVQKLNQKANEYMQAGEYDKAASRLEAILDLNPNFPKVHYNLGIAYYHMEEYEKSVEALNSYIDKYADNADAYYTRAIAYEDWAYELLEGDKDDEDEDENYKPSEEDKIKSTEYFKNAKADYEKYIELQQDAKDKDEVLKRIGQIEAKLSGKAETEE